MALVVCTTTLKTIAILIKKTSVFGIVVLALKTTTLMHDRINAFEQLKILKISKNIFTILKTLRPTFGLIKV